MNKNFLRAFKSFSLGALFAAALAGALMFVSCSNMGGDISPAIFIPALHGGAAGQGQSKAGSLCAKVSLPNMPAQKIAQSSAATTAGVSKSALPDASVIGVNYTFSATLTGGGKTYPATGEYDSSTGECQFSFVGAVKTSAATYTLTVDLNYAPSDSETKTIASGTKQVAVPANAKTFSAAVRLAPKTDSGLNGFLSLPLQFSDASVDSAQVILSDASGNDVAATYLQVDDPSASPATIAISGGSVTIKSVAAGLPGGIYNLVMFFYTGTKKCGQRAESVVIYPTLSTRLWWNGSDSGSGAGGALEISTSAQTEFWIRGTGGAFYAQSFASGWTASDDTSTNDGSFAAPFETLQAAIGMINAVGDATTQYTIVVDGLVNAAPSAGYAANNSSMGNISEARKITLKGYSSSDKDILDAEGAGRVLNVASGATVTLQNIALKNGSAVAGGCLNTAGTVEMQSGLITGGDSTAGSGVSVTSSGKFILKDGTVSGNIPSASGGLGGAFCVVGQLTIDGGEISGNSAERGGGIYCAGTVTMNKGDITGNTATFGGGVYIATLSGSAATFTLLDGNISSNEAQTSVAGTGFGAGVCNFDGTLEIKGGSISANTTTALGGGVYNLGSATMTAGTISQNEASEGAGIYTANDFYMSGGTVEQNTAAYGGGVCIFDKLFDMSGGTVQNNSAASGGGGVFVNNHEESGTTYTGVFSMSGDASVPYGTGNSVYLKNAITIAGDLSGGSEPVATLEFSDEDYRSGLPVLTASDDGTLVKNNRRKFAVLPDSAGGEWGITSEGLLSEGGLKTGDEINAILYDVTTITASEVEFVASATSEPNGAVSHLGYLDYAETIPVWYDSGKVYFYASGCTDGGGKKLHLNANSARMFAWCLNYKAISTKFFDASRVANMSYMFFHCNALTELDLSGFDTQHVYDMTSMFQSCSNLETIYASDLFDISCVTDSNSMFSECAQLMGGEGTTYDPSYVNITYARIDGPGFPGYFTAGGSSGGPVTLATPLTLEAMEDGAVVTFTNKANGPVTYKLSDGTEGTIAAGGEEAITLASVGDTVAFYGKNETYATGTASGKYSNIACSKDCYVYGNVMSLVDSDAFESETALSGVNTFYNLFRDNIHIKNKSGADLVLPATTLAQNCYASMFYGCKGLTSAPALPATNLASSCYDSMFANCAGLATAPELPATTLTEKCYHCMFYHCTSLVTPPELPATTMTDSCYGSMFNTCSSLATAPELPATVLAKNCYYAMFYCCTNLTADPVLPAATLAESCYESMFYACHNINKIKCLATDISAEDCTYNWLKYVASSGTFIKDPDMLVGGTGWQIGDSGIPSGWTTSAAVTLATPLTLEAMVAGAKVTFTNKAAGPVTYKLSDGTEDTIAAGGEKAITLAAVGDKVEFYGGNASYAPGGNSYSNASKIACSKDCYVYGNIMSLVKSAGFESETKLTGDYTFCYLFDGNAHIKNKSGADLFLPATTLASACYQAMFCGCTSLSSAPELPATTLAESCYDNMFGGCTSLSSAPVLPATTLDIRCYASMFEGCVILTSAPALPAITLEDSCYLGMFIGCASLVKAPVLPATTLADSCYKEMFYGCTSLTSAPALPATTLADSCYEEMFYDCTSLTSAPALPATTLEQRCYFYMFSGCASLTSAPALPATALADACYKSMFSGCTNLTSAPVLPAGTLVKDCYNEMFKDCANLNKVTCLATDISAISCTSNWLSGVASTGTFTKDAGTIWGSGSSGIPSGWTVKEVVTLATPLTLEAKVAGTAVTFTSKASGAVTYKKSDGTTGTIAAGDTASITLASAGDKVFFYGDNNKYAASTSSYSNIACSEGCYVYGNVMSLVKSSGFEKEKTLSETAALYGLFKANANISNKTDASLYLPATTLAVSCYGEMFSGCTSLTTAPELPAMELQQGCYMKMFLGSGLTKMPELPANTLAQACYSYMFSECAYLSDASELPAMNLATSCYSGMFAKCSSLYTAPKLPAKTLVVGCYSGMFTRCTSLNLVECYAEEGFDASSCLNNWLAQVSSGGVIYTRSGADWTSNSPSGIPSGWTRKNK